MTPARQRAWTLASLALLAATAVLSNTVLYRQEITGRTELTRRLPARIGAWELVEEQPASQSEIKGLETSDIIKRTYSNGRSYMELVVAYIAHSSRKSAHAQEACLRGAGAMVGSIADIGLDGDRVGAKLISIDLHEHRQWVCYWYKIGDTYTAQYLRSSLLMFLGPSLGRKHQGASLIRLLTPEARNERPEEVRARFQDFAHALLPELQKTLP